MPQWSANPPDDERSYALRILRAPTKGKLIALITSNDVLGCYTHFVNHRTLPCDGPSCPAHLKGFPARWHGYITALLDKTNEPILIELTAQAARAIADYRNTNGPLRGTSINLTRAAPRDNARVVVRLGPTDLSGRTIPPAPDIIACLSKIWGIPESEMHRDNPTHAVQELRIATENGNGKLSQPIRTDNAT